MTQNGPTDGHDGIVNRSVGQLNLPCHLSCGDFQFKELDQGKPLNATQPSLVNPSAGEVMEGIPAPGATISSIF